MKLNVDEMMALAIEPIRFNIEYDEVISSLEEQGFEITPRLKEHVKRQFSEAAKEHIEQRSREKFGDY